MPNTVNPPIVEQVSVPALHVEHFNRKFVRVCNYSKDTKTIKLTSVDVDNQKFYQDSIHLSKIDDVDTVRKLYSLCALVSSK